MTSLYAEPTQRARDMYCALGGANGALRCIILDTKHTTRHIISHHVTSLQCVFFECRYLVKHSEGLSILATGNSFAIASRLKLLQHALLVSVGAVISENPVAATISACALCES